MRDRQRQRSDHLLRDHHLCGLSGLFPHAGGLDAAGGGSGRAAGCDQCHRDTAPDHHHPGQPGPSAVSGRHGNRDCRGKGGYPQASGALRGRAAIRRRSCSHRSPRRPAGRAPAGLWPALARRGRSRADDLSGRHRSSGPAAAEPSRPASDPERGGRPCRAAPSWLRFRSLRSRRHPGRLARAHAAPAAGSAGGSGAAGRALA